MQTLNFIGRGSAFNVKEGNTSAYYIDKDNNLLLIDCGENIFERIVDKKLLEGVNNINVLITHKHSDHIGSLSSLIYYCHYVLGKNITVLYPDATLYDILYLMGHNDEEYNYKVLNLQVFNNIGDMYIQPVLTRHIKNHSCYGYYLNIRNKNIYYSGDTNKFNMGTINKCDETYQDTCLADYEGNVHLSLRKLCKDVPKEHRDKIYCMHIDCDELINRAKQEGFNVVEVD